MAEEVVALSDFGSCWRSCRSSYGSSRRSCYWSWRSVTRQLSSPILVRSVASPRNGSKISDMHQNTIHYVHFTVNQSLNTSVLPLLAGFLRVQSHGDQLSSLRTYYRHRVSPPTSVIGTHRTTQPGPPPRRLQKSTKNPAGAQTLYLSPYRKIM